MNVLKLLTELADKAIKSVGDIATTVLGHIYVWLGIARLANPWGNVKAHGQYRMRINGGDWVYSDNIVTTQGLELLLNIALGGTSKISNFYLGLFSGSATPAANWTAANFASNASEIISQTEGFAGVNRPAWTPSAASGSTINNFSSEASITIITSSSLNINGVALLTQQARGATTGSLISATKYPVTRVVQNGDILDIGYQLTLSST